MVYIIMVSKMLVYLMSLDDSTKRKGSVRRRTVGPKPELRILRDVVRAKPSESSGKDNPLKQFPNNVREGNCTVGVARVHRSFPLIEDEKFCRVPLRRNLRRIQASINNKTDFCLTLWLYVE